ncbi:hypothetical protein B5S31_g5024 [[Candida] boidinii]|nr:hypothetical protein B5S31_g5024 [[Candida] boidinii]OWB79610.1 hypothetical protein B5S32_g3839 [[Candida] boidinii]
MSHKDRRRAYPTPAYQVTPQDPNGAAAGGAYGIPPPQAGQQQQPLQQQNGISPSPYGQQQPLQQQNAYPGVDGLTQGMSQMNIQQQSQQQQSQQFPIQQQGQPQQYYQDNGIYGTSNDPQQQQLGQQQQQGQGQGQFNNNLNNNNGGAYYGNIAMNQNLNGITPAIGTPGAPGMGAYRTTSGSNFTTGNMGNNNQNQNSSASLPLNQLYSTDLLRDDHPPIAELRLPPPPIILGPVANSPGTAENNSPPDYFRSTLNVIPTTSSMLKKSKLPLALVVRPYISLHDSERPIPVVDDTVISRCRRCRSYINPFITFNENGRRWRCNFCGLLNDVPSAFDYNPITSTSANRMERKELNYSVVEFVAPSEYMVRPPQPLVYVFILDVSMASIQNGYLATVTRTILDSLDRIPNKNERAKVAFLAVDSNITYFTIPNDDEEEKNISMMIVSDLDDILIPSPDQLLVNLKTARKNIEKLLTNFSEYFNNNNEEGFALGPSLKSAHKLINSIGGKLIVFSSSLPNLGIGSLSIRDEESVSNKPKEASTLLTANNSFYKSFAVECNKSQVTVDMFLAGSTYQDVATLSNLPRYTSGQTHFYPAWSANRIEDITKLTKEISNHLSMEICLEAVMRVRGSSGLRMSAFYGNFFNRSSDLCSFPTFPRDQSYVIEMSIDEYIGKPYVYCQAAILHTTSFGERRIRVMTLGIPTSKELRDIYASADQLAITNYYAQKAIEKTLSSSLNESRDYLTKSLVDILSTYKKELVAGNIGSSSPLQLCTNLRMLPLLLHSLTKHIGFRSGRVPSDHRSAALNKLGSLPLPKLINYIYPTVYSLHSMEDDCGLPRIIESTTEEQEDESNVNNQNGEIVLPEPINASAAQLARFGLYLINNTSEIFLWIGGDAIPQLVLDVFGVENIADVPIGKNELPELDNEFNIRVRNIISTIREGIDSITYENLYIIRGPSANENAYTTNTNREVIPLRLWCLSDLVEDRANNNLSYKEFLAQLREKISS